MSSETQAVNGITDGFKLIVGPADGVIENADVPIRWCVPPSAVSTLEQLGIKNPMVVLSTSDANGDVEWRGVYPLGDLMAYARFYRAGEQRVYAVIVDGGDTAESIKEAERDWKRHDWDCYNFQIQECGEVLRSIDEDAVYGVTDTNVIIPEGVFGKEPSPGLKWFINWAHDAHHKVADQCEFRRRAMLAFSIKWIPMVAWSVIYTTLSLLWLTMLVMGGFASWVTNWKMAFRPFTSNNWSFMLDTSEGRYGGRLADSRFVPRITWNEHAKQPIFTPLIFSPLAVLFITFVSGIGVSEGAAALYELWYYTSTITLFFGTVALMYDVCGLFIYWLEKKTGNLRDDDYLERSKMAWVLMGGSLFILMLFLLIPTTIFVGGAVGIVALTIGISIYASVEWRDLYANTGKFIDKIEIWFWDTFLRNKSNDYTEMRELLCPGDKDNLSTDINMLPKEHRTWRLRFEAFKQKVCKPMQR